MVRNFFKVPVDDTSTIYPAKNLSVKQMMDFTMPSPAQSLSAATINPIGYFSQVAPSPITTILLMQLCWLPIPSISTVNKLCKVGNQAVLDGFQSVQYVHLDRSVTTHFPLWVVTYWVDVCSHQLTVHTPWAKATKWLQEEIFQKVSPEWRTLAEDVTAILHAILSGLI